jgi:hypothetical protein
MAKQEYFNLLKVVAAILLAKWDKKFGQEKVELTDKYVFNFSSFFYGLKNFLQLFKSLLVLY